MRGMTTTVPSAGAVGFDGRDGRDCRWSWVWVVGSGQRAVGSGQQIVGLGHCVIHVDSTSFQDVVKRP